MLQPVYSIYWKKYNRCRIPTAGRSIIPAAADDVRKGDTHGRDLQTGRAKEKRTAAPCFQPLRHHCDADHSVDTDLCLLLWLAEKLAARFSRTDDTVRGGRGRVSVQLRHGFQRSSDVDVHHRDSSHHWRHLSFFTRRNLGHRRLTEREDELIRQTHDAIPQPEGVLEKLEGDGSGTEDLVTYLNRSGCFPVYASTEISYFPMGEDKSTAMLEAIPFLIFREGVLQQLADTWGKS